MKKISILFPLSLLILALVGTIGEFLICFMRSYSELWYTILMIDVIALIPAVLAYIFKKEWLNIIYGIVMIGGALLMTIFPSYIMYMSYIVGGLVILGSIAAVILKKAQK